MRDAAHITLDEFIECAVKVGLSARAALTLARQQGYKVDNNSFATWYRDVKDAWLAGTARR